ncbi:RNA polymerase sigma-70 factor [Zobellia uliginosa]|uniref:RNA polymerase sigma-70 factor n=1 Tax=Zobellia uliginosa TaxID=143224 RepID=UPI0026E43989|nr:RNA polymerase sigma-70 factor [Zobellia uliginosa]MDO6518701.1 RNA polymerase sigma-70 factor [Zobellia uliginosa]
MRVENMTEEAMLVGLVAGQEKVFDYIFRKYYKNLCIRANAYVQDLDKAQSLVQDCFVKLWTKREEAGSITNLSSYLSFMVRNRCIDYIRKTESLRILHDNVKYEAVEIEFEDILTSTSFEDNLRRLIAQLPKRSRLAFEYSRFENLTYKEIAEKMDISNKAVEALIARALRMLRKDLKPYLSTLVLPLLFLSLY